MTATTEIRQMSARLVRITHYRCSEHDGSEYVLAPGDWSDEKISLELEAARKELLADATEIKESPLDPGFLPPYKDHPDLTVGTVQRLHAEQKRAYDGWRKTNQKLSRSLETRLVERGFYPLWEPEFDELTGVVDKAVDWSHNHGLTLNYGPPRNKEGF